MDKAYTSEYYIVDARDAVSGKNYYCPNCNGKLHFYPGRQRIPHFRHSKGVPREQKELCELYTRSNTYSLLHEEFVARQQIRMVIEKENNNFVFKMKFPIIQRNLLDLQIYDKYFNYYCVEINDFSLNSINLLPSRLNNDVKISLLRKYTFKSSNEQYEKILGLRVSGNYEPFREGPLVFKEMSGQYISIPYRKITLSGRFFVVSLVVISFDDEMEVLSKKQSGKFFIYEVLMPIGISEKLQIFFERSLKYILLPATCHIDLVSPSTFKKRGNTIEVSSKETKWQITNMGDTFSNQKIIIENKSFERQVITLNNMSQFNLSLIDDEYNIYIDRGISEIKTVKKVYHIKHSNTFKQELLLKDTNVLFDRKVFRKNEVIEVQSTLPYYISSSQEIDHKINTKERLALNNVTQIIIPTLWSIKVESGNDKGALDLTYIYSIYKNHKLYPKVLCTIETIQILINKVRTSKFNEKNKLLYLIRLIGYKVPRPIATCMKEIEHSDDSPAENI
ncbi:competence protein CoiA family protein [Planococcus sp. N064]|uniref:Competence protein CoiA family protein n=1 Tax=Planococcus liqunii TaxID=3058394 RepID=A0ABT8MTE8_9BACL|nr:competence protein CoiA family protein [Planococcus sp. N064]MDN7228187.1 competence protein CoiA family protein [Planococcus sp. N064]